MLKLKSLLLIICCILFCFDGIAQNEGKMNFAMSMHLRNPEFDKTEMVHMLLQGDVMQIEQLVNTAGGYFKFAAGNIASVILSIDQLSSIITNPAIKKVEAFPPTSVPFSDSVLCHNNILPIHAGQSPLAAGGYDGTGVIVGIIDTGIDFNHPDFHVAPNDSRILWLWDQRLPLDPSEPFGYGKEWSKADIDFGLCTHDPTAFNGHGTHVAGLAVGNGRATGGYLGTAPNADIIFVATDFSNNSAIDAVSYIYAKAVAAGKPCVINASFGSQYGPRDGRDTESQAIQTLINAKVGQALVAAAGNDGNIGDVHLEYTVTSDTNLTMFPPISGPLNFIDFVMVGDSNDLKNIEITIGADKMFPANNHRGNIGFVNISSIPIGVMQSANLNAGFGSIGDVYYQLDTFKGDYNLEFVIVSDSSYNWRLETTGVGKFDLWNYNYRFNPPTEDYKTLSTIVNSGIPSMAIFPDSIYYKYPDANKTIAGNFQNLDEVIAVGSYVNRKTYPECGGVNPDTTRIPGIRESSSSIGPTRDGRIKPDVSAPGGNTIAAYEATFRGLLNPTQNYKMATGCFHGRSSQTSHAAPSIAGMAALYLQQNSTATAIQVRDAIRDNAYQDAYTGATPNNTWGYGKGDGFAALTGVPNVVTHPSPVSICVNGNTTFVANHTDATMTYRWQVDFGTGFGFFADGAPFSGVNTNILTITGAPLIIDGYKFRCVISSLYSCDKITNEAELTIEPEPTASAGGRDTICENASAVVTGATATNGTISWAHSGSGNITFGGTTVSPTYAADAGDAGSTVILTMTVTSTNSCAPTTSTATYSVTVDPLPTASAGGTDVICENQTATVSGATATNGSILWTENGAGSLSSANSLTPIYTPLTADANSTIVLTMKVTSTNNCSPISFMDTYSVTVDPLPSSIAGGSQTICENESAIVSGASSANGTVFWTENGAGSLSGATTDTPVYTPLVADTSTTVTLTMTVTTTNTCSVLNPTDVASYSVSIDPKPRANISGLASQTICAVATATVSGATYSNGSIFWTENGTGAITSGINSLTPVYTPTAGDAGNAVVLTMSVSGVNGCSSYTATATYSVTIDPEPTASAGGTKIICENASATVSGASAPIGSISWGNNGSGSLSNPTTLTPTYTPLVADTGSTVTLTMTVTTTNACSAIMPTAIYSVNVDPLPRASIIGSAIQTICVIDTATVLVGEADAKSGSVRWEHDGLGSIVLGAFSSLTPSYKPAAGDAGSAVILSFIVYNSNACGSPISDTADYTINVDGLPVATAGGMDTICLNASTIVSGASASHGTISWTYPVGGGSITLGATTFTPTYTAAVGDIGSPVTLTMTVLSANTCSLTSATALAYYFITVDTLPLSIVGGDTITCENIPLTIIGASKSYGTISWTHNGLGTLSDSITLTPTYYPNTGDIGDTITLVQEVISDNKCLSNSNTDTLKLIVKPPPPSVTLSGLAPSYCFNAAATNLIGLPTGGIYSGNGIVDPVLGVFNPFVAGSGTHTIVYTYTDTSNCWDTANIATIVLTEPFVVDSCTSFNLRSNVFSPNGDGINDEFTLDFEGSASLYTGDASGNFEINIFSRWGVVVFTATSPNVTWDGYSTAGEQLTAGTYYYVIDMFGEQTRGFITLIR